MEIICDKLIKFKRIIAIMIMTSIIFTSLHVDVNNFVFAATEKPSDEEILADMKKEVEDFLKDPKNNIYKYPYKSGGKEQIAYAVKMPKPDDDSKIIYDPEEGRYAYQVYDTTETIMIGYVYFDVHVLMSEGNKDLPKNLTVDNYGEYTGRTTTGIIELQNDELVRLVSVEDTNEKPEIAFAVELDNGDFIASKPDEVKYRDGSSLLEKFLDAVTDVIGFAFGWVESVLTEIFNSLLLLIADGIKALINLAVGEDVTIYKIIFGKIDKFTINFWEVTNPTPVAPEEEGLLGGETPENKGVNSPSSTLATVVMYWFNEFRGIAIAVYLVMLLYIGIRILLSSTGKSGQKYKEMLTSWLVGIVILMFYPYVMKYTVIINDLLIEMMDPKATQGEVMTSFGDDDYSNIDAMKRIRDDAEKKNDIALTIIYIIMLGQLIVLIGVYYKRVFMMAFLITIFPVVAGMYIWEKTKGGGKSLTIWTKEYVILVLTQTFHAVVYVVLVDGAYIAFQKSNNWFIFMISVLFLFEAEKIIRTIFGMRSSANTIGDLATAGAATLAAASKVKDITKDNNPMKPGAQTGEAAENIAKEAKKNVAVDNALSQSQQNNNNSSNSHGGLSNGGNANQNTNNAPNGGENASNGAGNAPTDGENPPSDGENVPTEGENAPTEDENPSNEEENNSAEDENPSNEEENTPAEDGNPSNEEDDASTDDENVPGGANNAQADDEENENTNDDLQAAKAVVTADALKGRAKRGAFGKALNITGRAAGITLGATSGLAMGSAKDAVANAAIGNELGNLASKPAMAVTGWATGLYEGENMRRKIESGEMDEELRKAGYDLARTFDPDPVVNQAKADLVRKALAKQAEITRRKGAAAGEAAFMDVIEEGRKKSGF